jgi:hypothetical protein
MKRAVLLIAVIVVVAFLSVRIVESVTDLSFNINDHLWLNFIGTWQCYEQRSLAIEFNMDETFTEYNFDSAIYSGTVQISGNEIILKYDDDSCRRKNLRNCSVAVDYSPDRDTLILVIDNRRLTFRRDESAR